MEINTREVIITNTEKVLFPNSGITKKDVILYYEKIADYMLPYMKNRPLTLQRFPKGINEIGFFQKNASDYFPEWILTKQVKKEGGWVNQVICNDKETLLYLVNQYVITFHLSLSRIDTIKYPDRLIFDLDPPEGNFKLAKDAANILRNFLEDDLELKTFLMTTGSKGLHVVVPLKRHEDFNEVHEFTKQIANYIANKYPNNYTTAIRKNQRKGRLYIDFLRNSYAQTSVAPYSLRAIENTPVATPLYWNELDDIKLNSQFFTINSIFKRLENISNPWFDFNDSAKSISHSKEKLKAFL
ncbi:MAG: bifunctional non-homologous end joining protein LigD [Flavobacterium sp.]|jgi:bifunctional non-homologous end joining protein LigD